MPRTNVPAQTTPGAYPVIPITANAADLTETAADVANGNSTPLINAKTYVLAHNTGASARTVTFTSVPDASNRSGDITAYSVGAGEIAQFGPFRLVGWSQSGTVLWMDASHAEVKWIVVTLPT